MKINVNKQCIPLVETLSTKLHPGRNVKRSIDNNGVNFMTFRVNVTSNYHLHQLVTMSKVFQVNHRIMEHDGMFLLQSTTKYT